MNTLSLINPEHPNGIRYKISKFPDGQQSIDIDTSSIEYPCGIVTIMSRLNSFMDLELIICANQALKSLSFPVEGVNLYVPYFLGARSDRKFVDGGINYLKQVICPIINSQGFNKVIVMDPHSSSLECCLHNFIEIKNNKLVLFAIDTIYNSDVVKE
jgi:ribose-phosphate pyrophosphokinase